MISTPNIPLRFYPQSSVVNANTAKFFEGQKLGNHTIGGKLTPGYWVLPVEPDYYEVTTHDEVVLRQITDLQLEVAAKSAASVIDKKKNDFMLNLAGVPIMQDNANLHKARASMFECDFIFCISPYCVCATLIPM